MGPCCLKAEATEFPARAPLWRLMGCAMLFQKPAFAAARLLGPLRFAGGPLADALLSMTFASTCRHEDRACLEHRLSLEQAHACSWVLIHFTPAINFYICCGQGNMLSSVCYSMRCWKRRGLLLLSELPTPHTSVKLTGQRFWERHKRHKRSEHKLVSSIQSGLPRAAATSFAVQRVLHNEANYNRSPKPAKGCAQPMAGPCCMSKADILS